MMYFGVKAWIGVFRDFSFWFGFLKNDHTLLGRGPAKGKQTSCNEEKEMDKVVFSVINPREIRISTIIFYYPIKSY